ncbi:hypothetical protein POX_c03772 [Penicillium oxalicum]|uniref:hypothetical protein n=1 Tax=Penicillium oxalicum TaxID=69781 RepID=UPI0020B7DB7F|nr:hypothetical protein POX_c03772 [Penicillium oxalicum]KAI2790921.1 hypothetical protein POX_c03772 [Penicillium oxalicum]
MGVKERGPMMHQATPRKKKEWSVPDLPHKIEPPSNGSILLGAPPGVEEDGPCPSPRGSNVKKKSRAERRSSAARLECVVC